MTIVSFNERKIAELKVQIAGETKARMAAEERALDAEARADRAEHGERECGKALRELRRQVDQLEAILKSAGVTA